MVSKKQLYNDLDEIAKITDSVYFSYTDLTTKNVTPGRGVNYGKFFNTMKDFLGDKYKEILVDKSVTLENASKETVGINFGPASFLGGKAVDLEGGKNLLFFYSDKGIDGKHVVYHEAAHLIQKKQDMFNAESLAKADKFLSVGVKSSEGNARISKDFLAAEDYRRHLREAHANAFASACMLLNSKNSIEYKLNEIAAKERGYTHRTASILLENKDYPSFKYYDNSRTQNATVKHLKDAKKDGSIKSLYKENGQIDFLKLSKTIEDIVVKNAYSPKEFRNVLDRNVSTPEGIKNLFDTKDFKNKLFNKDSLKKLLPNIAKSTMYAASSISNTVVSLSSATYNGLKSASTYLKSKLLNSKEVKIAAKEQYGLSGEDKIPFRDVKDIDIAGRLSGARAKISKKREKTTVSANDEHKNNNIKSQNPNQKQNSSDLSRNTISMMRDRQR